MNVVFDMVFDGACLMYYWNLTQYMMEKWRLVMEFSILAWESVVIFYFYRTAWMVIVDIDFELVCLMLYF
jgi:hypothetical protein